MAASALCCANGCKNTRTGNTPIRPEEAEQLIPRISTIGELNEYEALNILLARDLVAKGDARTRYLAALRTLGANENDVKSMLEFARS
jgi:hypothetical protein